jgi:acetyl-CoA carboxylase carboxyltransferase component
LHASTAHFVVLVRSGSIGLSGPSVVEPAIGEKVSDGELGGPVAATEVGNVHLVVDTEADAMGAIAALLSYLPQSSAQCPPLAPPLPPGRDPRDLERFVRMGARSGYDIKVFVQLCDTFGLPLVFLHDVPGLMIGTQAERGGILHGYEALVSAIAEATVPKVGVVLRKAYGGGHFAMGGRPTRPDFLYAWPSAELGFMAPETGSAPSTAGGWRRCWPSRARRGTRRWSRSSRRNGSARRSPGRPPRTSRSTTSSNRAGPGRSWRRASTSHSEDGCDQQ